MKFKGKCLIQSWFKYYCYIFSPFFLYEKLWNHYYYYYYCYHCI